uniref:Uncharacterized protein n=1 Tax=Lactuca sativa TaxID=4236 RepID=A0A9R1VUI9_LACSA|nr:hypothetical protein LSAT_V11C400204830 [Lactuca sativa]
MIKYEKFKENFHESTNGYKKILKIKDIDMKNFFVRYFKEINHPRANAISKESIKPQRHEMSWRTAKVLDLAENYQKIEFKVHTDHAYKAMQTIQKRLKEY